MFGFLSKINGVVLIAIFAVMTGCTTYVSKVKKLDGYDKKMSEVMVSWVSPTTLKTSIRKTGQGVGGINSEDKEASKNGIKTLLSLFAEHGVSMVSEGLGNNSVTTIADPEKALRKLTFTAVNAETKCVPLGCTHNLRIYVRVFDVELNKAVWTASFLVGKPYAVKSDEETLKSFVGSLIGELKGDKLL